MSTNPFNLSSDPFHIIPGDRRTEVAKAFGEIFKTGAVEDIVLLSGGFSGSLIYKVVINNKAYVLKLNPPQPDLNSDIPSTLAYAAATGVAPALYFEDRQKGISISEFIVTKPLQAALSGDNLATELAVTIQTFHNVQYSGPGKDLFQTVDELIAWFRKANILSAPQFDECFAWFEKIKSVNPFDKNDLVLSHNDLNPNNVLCDGKKLWIIDWDVACLNDRYIDLANTANFYLHTEAQELLYLDTYFNGDVDHIKLARLYIMRQVCRIIYSMMMFQLASMGKPESFLHNQQMNGYTLKEFVAMRVTGTLSLADYEGRLFYGKALLNEALHAMRGDRFKNALAVFPGV